MEKLLKYNLFPQNKVAEFSGVAPSPLKDFYHLLLTTDKIILRWWKITSRNDGSKFHPGETQTTYEDFIYDERMHLDIQRVFDQDTLDYVMKVAQGKLDLLPRMPNAVLFRIVSFLDLEDISSLSNVSKRFAKLCTDNELWKMLYCLDCPTPVDAAIEELGDLFGWKKLFFTNKLQLQVQLRRVRSARDDRTDDTGDISPTSSYGDKDF